jgi:hypothetical protein
MVPHHVGKSTNTWLATVYCTISNTQNKQKWKKINSCMFFQKKSMKTRALFLSQAKLEFRNFDFCGGKKTTFITTFIVPNTFCF